jgi:hypothetical protein
VCSFFRLVERHPTRDGVVDCGDHVAEDAVAIVAARSGPCAERLRHSGPG